LLRAKDSSGEISADSELFRFYLQGFSAGVAVTACLVSQRGEFQGESGSSDDLSWREDRALVAALRRNSEIVLTTGKTARAEKLGMPKTAKLALISESRNLENTRLDKANPDLLLLSGQDKSWKYFAMLRDYGFKNIQCEFGPGTMAESWNAGQIDLLCVSSLTADEPFDLGAKRQVFELEIGKGWVRGFVSGVATMGSL
jgi:hypothetical protein